jgi:2-(1,2-epoxy-1,2-dihydrophenyl)acetyl-CoA isomerase
VEYESLDCQRDGSVARITLNRPARLNALTPELQAELRSALSRLADDGKTRCLILTGAGRGFRAGSDLVDADLPLDEEGLVDLGESLERDFNPTVVALTRAPFPTIAAVNGPCVGAGMSIALACDLVVAARSAYFYQAFCNVGLVPDAGSTYLLPRALGAARAAGLMLLGRKLPAEDAAAWGLIWQCVPDEDLAREADELARELSEKPTRTLVLCRQALLATSLNDLDRQLALERELQRVAGRTGDTMEGIRAFREKRPPRFVGH